MQEGKHFRNHSLIIVTDTLPIYKTLCLGMKNALCCGVATGEFYWDCIFWIGESLSEPLLTVRRADWGRQDGNGASICVWSPGCLNCLVSKNNTAFPISSSGVIRVLLQVWNGIKALRSCDLVNSPMNSRQKISFSSGKHLKRIRLDDGRLCPIILLCRTAAGGVHACRMYNTMVCPEDMWGQHPCPF